MKVKNIIENVGNFIHAVPVIIALLFPIVVCIIMAILTLPIMFIVSKRPFSKAYGNVVSFIQQVYDL